MNCKTCRYVLEFKRAILCTKAGQLTELHYCCEDHSMKQFKTTRNKRMIKI